MDWPTLSSIAQIIGTVAVVLTLIYLAWEVRQNTDSIQAAAREATAIGDAYTDIEGFEVGLPV